jgi:uncharacterized membrane protein YfhO
MNKNSAGKSGYYKFYTVLFFIISVLILSWYYIGGRTLVWREDGYSQHIRALTYYAQYLRSIIREFLASHTLVIPNWDFSIGEGSDVLSSLHYYVIGDPFSFFSVCVPTRFMYLYYEFMILLRIYLAGIAFSKLCFYTKAGNRYAVLAGSLTYTFCYWTLYNISRHPYFLNPLIYLPLLILGVEKILKKERPYVFILSVALAAVSNFYFFYVQVLLVVIYVMIRLVLLYRRDIRSLSATILKLGSFAIFGILLAAIVFLPIAYVYLGDARMSAENAHRLFYPLSYYSKLPGMFVASGTSYWTCLGFSVPTLLATLLLFRKKHKHTLEKCLLILCVIFMCFPIFGQIFNAFSYMANRWSFAIALLVAYVLTDVWSELMHLQLRDALFLFGSTAVYCAICLLFEYSRTTNVFVSIAFLFALLFILLPITDGKPLFSRQMRQILTLILLVASIVNNAFWLYSSAGDNYADQSVEIDEVSSLLTTNETVALKEIMQSDTSQSFYRYSGNALTTNANILTGISSSQYYWSMSNTYVSKFRQALAMRENMIEHYTGYDDRAALLSLSATKYYVTAGKKTENVPYGFTYVATIDVKESILEETKDLLKNELQVSDLSDDQITIIENAVSSTYSIYKNEYVLPLAYAYDTYITEAYWNTLSSVEKQEALLQSVVLEDDTQSTIAENDALSLTSTSIPYSVECGSGVSLQDNTFAVTSANASVTLKLDGSETSETYVSINGLYFEGVSTYDLYNGEKSVDPLNLYNQTTWNLLSYAQQEAITKENIFWNAPRESVITLKASTGTKKKFSYYTPEYNYYSNRHDFTVNLNYAKQAVQSVTISFSKVGTYSFDSIEVICQPMTNYKNQIKALKSNALHQISVTTDTVSGTITTDQTQLLCFAIPYSKGWRAYVDGVEQPLYKANLCYMAVELNAGEHNIVLKYHTPLLKAGVWVSVVSWLLFLGFIVIDHRRTKKKI